MAEQNLQRWGIELDANGYVKGLVSNSGDRTDFLVRADQIRIATPGSSTGFTPFDAAQYLTEPEDVAELLTAALESGNPDTVARACAIVARTAEGKGN